MFAPSSRAVSNLDWSLRVLNCDPAASHTYLQGAEGGVRKQANDISLHFHHDSRPCYLVDSEIGSVHDASQVTERSEMTAFHVWPLGGGGARFVSPTLMVTSSGRMRGFSIPIFQ
jgi:hypothetical protein